jgi:hypothetical protein
VCKRNYRISANTCRKCRLLFVACETLWNHAIQMNKQIISETVIYVEIYILWIMFPRIEANNMKWEFLFLPNHRRSNADSKLLFSRRCAGTRRTTSSALQSSCGQCQWKVIDSVLLRHRQGRTLLVHMFTMSHLQVCSRVTALSLSYTWDMWTIDTSRRWWEDNIKTS